MKKYSYDFYFKYCNILKESGFNPNRILDIGANIGETADIMRITWPNAHILLFEGNETCEDIYKIKKYNYQIKLLGKENGTTTFYKSNFHPMCSGNSIYRENSNEYNDKNVIIETKSIYKLDDCVNEKYDLIKIDTQGSELDIIQGGINVFNNAKVIIIEVAVINANEGGCSKESIMQILGDLKYNFIMPIEAVFNKKQEATHYNLLFIKP